MTGFRPQPDSAALLLSAPRATLHAAFQRVRHARRILKTAAGRTDRERWKNPDDPAYETAERNRLIAGFIPAGSAVLDLGAGVQHLRRFLPSGCEYQPCDLAGGPDVLRCDFNVGLYPAVARRYDVLVSSGVLEFIREPETFLAELPGLGDTLLLSYRVRPPGEPLLWRLQSGYLNHMTEAELEAMLDRTEYPWRRVAVFEHRGYRPHLQPIYLLTLDSPAASDP